MKKNPIRLNDSFKAYTFDQDKACTPEETVKQFKARLEKVDLDILKDVQRIDNGRLDIPVYFSLTGKDAYKAIGNKKQMGKGSTPGQSMASACMELGERFSFFSFKKNTDNFITDTYANLKAQGQKIMPLEQILQSVHDQETSLETLEKLIGDIPIQWTWATNLNREEEFLIPFTWFYAINEFNGPSAGNTYEEAIVQGISEIVERHVCAVVTHKKLKTPAINIATIQDPVCRELIHKFTKHGIAVYLNDFTLDTGIPTISALCVDLNTFPESSEIVYTAGTTPNAEKALIRALTEVAQLAGDFNSNSNYVASGLPKPLSLEEVDYIVNPDKNIDLDKLPDLSDNNLRQEIVNMLKALENLNMEVYLVNTIHPKLQIPAIYTIVPGCHFRERSMLQSVGLFAAKLVFEQSPDPVESTARLLKMKKILPDAYYLEFYLG
ncbi:MAG: YcaO-like family protein, partial [Proteobacteria bacterium]|nr:YcaO-like family protein [Pseudomonadota bacterium]